MDFLDPKKKRAHEKRLFLGYFLVGVAILLAAIILVFQAYGFDLDRRSGQVIQNGLIFAASAPETSTIYLNGKENGQTDKRLAVPSGSYNLELKRDGYRTWKRSFFLEGGSIERLSYAVLFPDKLTPKDRQAYAQMPGFSTNSPDRRWIVVAQPDSLTRFDVFDANSPKTAVAALALPDGVMTPSAEAQTLTLVEWSTDNRHFLVRHGYGEASEFIMVDRADPANSLNINQHLGINPSTVSLRDKKFDKLYLYDQATKALTRADTKTKQITPYLNNVTSYKSYGGNVVLFSQADSKNNTEVVKLRNADKEYVLRRDAATTNYQLNLAEYNNHWYVAVASLTNNRVYIYRDPMSEQSDTSKSTPSLFTTLIMDQPSELLFSANSRFIMTHSGGRFAVYDAELNRRHYYEIANVSADTSVTWMDGHRLVLTQGGALTVFDYDGINQQKLVTASTPTGNFFSSDFLRLYTLAPSVADPAKSALTQTALKLNLKD